MWIVYGIGTLIIVAAALILPRVLLKEHPIKPPSTIGGSTFDVPDSSANDQSSVQFATSFGSAADHFTARFPEYPKTKNSTLPINGGTATIHDYSVNSGAASYSVQVVNYPSNLDMSDKDARLKAAVDGAAKATSATVESSQLGTFGGERSIESITRVTVNGQVFHNYALSVLKGRTLYLVVAIHSNQADFTAFKRAFHLSQ